MTLTAWTEASLQNHLARRFNRTGSLCVPNCGVYGWEADLIRVSSRLFVSEYEIKVIRSDFRNDRKKEWRYIQLEDGERKPNQFWFVAPQGVVPIDELPEFAGLLEVYSGGATAVAKVAPKLHRRPIATKDLLYLTRGCALRYWRSRSER